MRSLFTALLVQLDPLTGPLPVRPGVMADAVEAVGACAAAARRRLDGLRQWLATWIEAFPDVRWTVEEQIGEEDQVWSRSTWQGTHQGPYLGLPATGHKVTAAVWTINRVVGGKIAEARWMRDRLGMMQQLGVIP